MIICCRERRSINQEGLIKRQTQKSGDVAHSPGLNTPVLYIETREAFIKKSISITSVIHF